MPDGGVTSRENVSVVVTWLPAPSWPTIPCAAGAVVFVASNL